MSAVAGVLMLFVGLLMLWAFSAVLISILAGLTTSALLWLVLNLWRRRQLKKALAQKFSAALKEVAAANADVEGAVETLALHIKNGSAGIWGPIPMPPNVVTEEEATILAEWVLSLK